MRQNTPAFETERGQLLCRSRGDLCHSGTQWACSKQSLHVEGTPRNTEFLQPGNLSLNLSYLSWNNYLEAAGTGHTCSSHLTFEQKTRPQPIRKCTRGPNLPYSLSDRAFLRMLRFQTKVISIGQQGIQFSRPHILKSIKIKNVYLSPQFACNRFLQLYYQVHVCLFIPSLILSQVFFQMTELTCELFPYHSQKTKTNKQNSCSSWRRAVISPCLFPLLQSPLWALIKPLWGSWFI